MDLSILDSTLSFLSNTTSCISHLIDYIDTVFSSIYHNYLVLYIVDAFSDIVLGGLGMGLGGLLLNNDGVSLSGYGGSYGGGGYGVIRRIRRIGKQQHYRPVV